MNGDARNGRDQEMALEWIKERLRGFGAVEPPPGLKERLLAAIACRSPRPALPGRARRWYWATGGAGIAATVAVVCGVLWFHTPPAAPPLEIDPGPQRVLAVDHNSVRPVDINALDSNGVY